MAKGVRLKTKIHNLETQLTKHFFRCHYFLKIKKKVLQKFFVDPDPKKNVIGSTTLIKV